MYSYGETVCSSFSASSLSVFSQPTSGQGFAFSVPYYYASKRGVCNFFQILHQYSNNFSYQLHHILV